MNMGLDEEKELKENEMEESTESGKKKRAPFAYWTVDGKEYKLKLTTAVICQLEEKFKRNLLSILFDTSSGGVPPLAVMLTIVQGAMKNWNHSIKYADVQKLFDKYCEEGGTQLNFLTDVLMEVYKVSGFFSEEQQEEMDLKMEEARELL